MIDLDHFKSVNDQYGHAMGDEVLRSSAQAIAETLRISDLVARWGGEEFCAFFPDTTTEGAITALNKALAAVRDLHFTPPDAAPFGITFSAGLAMFTPGTPVEATIEAADHLLYLAKHGGRNRIASTADAAAPPRQLIVLVEDDDSVASMVSKVLMREGFDVHRCADGSAARAALEEKKFVLAIFDVNLPDTTGFELLADMRERRHLARVPVVMLTGSAEESDVVRGFELGVNDYMTKPFYAAELLARIRRLLKR